MDAPHPTQNYNNLLTPQNKTRKNTPPKTTHPSPAHTFPLPAPSSRGIAPSVLPYLRGTVMQANAEPNFVRAMLSAADSRTKCKVAVRPEGYKRCPNRFFFPAITDVTQIYSEGGVKKVRVFEARSAAEGKLRTFSRQAS